jgi:hypothetical protein
MTAPRAASAPDATGVLARAGQAALLAAVVAATLAAVLAGCGPLAAIVPALLAAVLYALVKAPLRWSAAALLFVMLAVDDHSENVGQWRTPLAHLGDLVHNRLDNVTSHLSGVALTGMEVVALVLLLVWAHRRATGAGVDLAGRVPTARVLRALVLVYVAAVVVSLAVGFANGQGLVPWKVRNLLHPILLLVVFDAAFRGPADHALVARVVVAAAAIRAVLAVVVQRIAIAETGGKYATATSHGDSVLFAVAIFLVAVDLLERPDARRLLRAALLVPLLLLGMRENGRRLVWVMTALMGVVTYALVPMRGWKRALTRAMLVVLPVAAVYAAVGWNREGRIFRPVQIFRGVADTSYDHSAYWREVENWNIAVTMQDAPLLGIGLGGRYVEHMANDDISNLYREYREWPHNTVLGQFLLLGALGFTATWSLFAAALFLAFRAHRLAARGEARAAALGCVGTLVACHVLAYGDTGAHYPQYKIFVALAIALAGKLAVATGAWPARGSPSPSSHMVER